MSHPGKRHENRTNKKRLNTSNCKNTFGIGMKRNTSLSRVFLSVATIASFAVLFNFLSAGHAYAAWQNMTFSSNSLNPGSWALPLGFNRSMHMHLPMPYVCGDLDGGNTSQCNYTSPSGANPHNLQQVMVLNANRTLISAGQSVQFTNSTSYSYNSTCTQDDNHQNHDNSHYNGDDIHQFWGHQYGEEKHECGQVGSEAVRNYTGTYSYSVSPSNGVVQSGNIFTFSSPGTYNVTLTDNFTRWGSTSNSVYITVTPMLSVALSANRTMVAAGHYVSFTNVTSGGTGSNAYSYSLSNSTGVVELGNSFLFNRTGNYTVTLSVTDLSGETASSSQTVGVTAPKSSFAVSLNSSMYHISADQYVHLSNTVVGGTGNYSYAYVISPSGYALGTNNTLAFTSPGVYNVTLNVNDLGNGKTASSSIVLNVSAQLKITGYTASMRSISAGQSVTFYNSTTGGTGSNVYTYLIDGSPTSVLNNTIMFPNTGRYYVMFKVTDLSGEEANTEAIPINVSAPLNITSFTTNALSKSVSISAGQSVTFLNTTAGGTGSNVYTYYINGIPMNSVQSNMLEFNATGTYAVTLGVSDISGETAVSAPLSVTVT